MTKIDKLKKIEDIGWEYFKASGDINAYGMVVSAREKRKELEKEQSSGYEM